MQRIIKISLFSLSMLLLLAQCGSSKNAGTKCDGKKATKTSMGNM